MSLYLLCLAIGAIGLVSMALTGLGRHGHGHVGARLGGRGRAGHGHSPGRGAQPHHAAGVRATATAWLWNLTSPRLLFSVLIGLSTAAGTAAVTWVGASHVLSGQITVGTILVFLSYLAALYAPLESLMYTSNTIQNAATATPKLACNE